MQNNKRPRESLNHCRNVKIAHNIIKRSLDKLLEYSHCESIKSDIENYVGFLKTFLAFVNAHHHHEEQFEFVLLKKYGFDIDQQELDHHNLLTVLDDISTFAVNGCSELSEASMQLLRTNLSKLRELMIPHLELEESIVTPDSLEQAGVTNDKLIQLDKDIKKSFSETVDINLMLPLVKYSLDEDERNSVWNTNFPFLLRRVIFPLKIKKVFYGYWRYAAYPPKKLPRLMATK